MFYSGKGLCFIQLDNTESSNITLDVGLKENKTKCESEISGFYLSQTGINSKKVIRVNHNQGDNASPYSPNVIAPYLGASERGSIFWQLLCEHLGLKLSSLHDIKTGNAFYNVLTPVEGIETIELESKNPGLVPILEKTRIAPPYSHELNLNVTFSDKISYLPFSNFHNIGVGMSIDKNFCNERTTGTYLAVHGQSARNKEIAAILKFIVSGAFRNFPKDA